MIKELGIYVAGFASGWVVRSAVDSSRSASVTAVARAYGVVDAVKRAVANEREFFEDLVAEGHARYEATRAARAARRAGTQASAHEGVAPARGDTRRTAKAGGGAERAA